MTKQRKRNSRTRGKATTVAAGEFKAHCLSIMDEVRDTHIEVIITKYGKPVAKLVPVEEETPDSFGSLRGTVVYHDDIVAPDAEEWDEVDS